jgi:methionyl-tRNA formyltransferase
MRIVFLGTPEFAVASLDALLRSGHQIAGVITAPDKPAGRGLLVRESAVKQYSVLHGLKVLQPVKLSDPEFLQEVRSLSPDLMIVVAFRMMPEALWQMPPLGTFNLHGSLLPQYRGAAPINRAVMNGEHETGVTTFFLKHQIDTGNIIMREHTEIGPDETAGELHDRLMLIGAGLVVKTADAIRSGQVQVHPQETYLRPGTQLHEAPKLFPDDCKIHWDKSAGEIHNHIRGLSPFPGAFTTLVSGNDSIHFKVYRSRPVECDFETVPGTITGQEGKLIIHCGSGLIEILELQQQGKKKMTAGDFLRGFRNHGAWRAV